MNRISFVSVALALSIALGGCSDTSSAPASTQPPPTAPAPAPAPAGLATTSWKLIGFQSMDDAQGTTKPEEGRAYTLEFGADGALAMQLDCNRGRATWSGTSSGDGGSLKIGPVASTRALCPQPDMGQMMAARLPDVVSYTRRDGHLFLALKMDSGIFEFAPQ